jgi:hypothetical protein
MPVIMGTLICVALAFLVWSTLAIMRRELGRERFVAVLLNPPAAPPEHSNRH